MTRSYSLFLSLIVIFFEHSVQARTQTTLDYESRIHPEIADDFMVVSQNKHATEAGYEILKKGDEDDETLKIDQ